MILLTGASGFVGKELVSQIKKQDLATKCVVRCKLPSPVNERSTIRIDSISSYGDWGSAR